MTARKVPHDIAAERALIGSMLLVRSAADLAVGSLHAEDFYVHFHREAFGAIQVLHARGSSIDPVTVAGILGDEARRPLVEIQADTPASAHAASYAHTVANHAAARRALAFAVEIDTAARASDGETLAQLGRTAEEHLTGPAVHVEPGVDIRDFVDQSDDDAAEDWVIRDVLDRGEVLMLTGAEGAGKTTWMRQLATQTAVGRHPFQRTDETPRTVLYVDLQDPPKQIRREFRKFLDGPARKYARGSNLLVVKSRPQGMDLTNAQDAAWLDALVVAHNPALVCLGPLYRAYRGSERMSKQSEEAADAVTDVLARLLVRRGCALILEGHSVHDGDKQDYRPRGSRLWEGWPTFGFGLAPMKLPNGEPTPAMSVAGTKLVRKFKLVPWRGQRDRDRPWPQHLLAQGFDQGWPWAPPDDDPSTVRSMPIQDTVF